MNHNILIIVLYFFLLNYDFSCGNAGDFKSFKNISGKFTQEIFFTDNDIPDEKSYGNFWVSKPSFLRWETLYPEEQLLLSNGSKIWFYDKLLKQVVISDAKEYPLQSLYSLINRDWKELEQYFEIKLQENNNYKLIPKKNKSSLFEFIEVFFDKEGLAYQINIQTSVQQIVKIHFSDISFKNIPQSLYLFINPKDADILE